MRLVLLVATVALVVGCEPARDKQLDVQRAGLVRELAETQARGKKRIDECNALIARADAPSANADALAALEKAPSTAQGTDERLRLLKEDVTANLALSDALNECAENGRTYVEVVSGIKAKIADIVAVQPPAN